jgi:hypothetical protein
VWSADNDGTGTQTPDPFTLTGGQACLSGSGFTQWGALIELTPNGPSGTVCPFDISGYTGIRFTASGAINNGVLRFALPIPATTDVVNGGTCTASPPKSCGDNFGQSFPAFGGNATTFEVPFASVSQEGWNGVGIPAAWDPHNVLALMWFMHENYMQTESFSNVCVTNVSFY